MKLETKSRERLERGKALLSEYLAGVARHRVDSIKDLDVAMEEHAGRPKREPTDEIPEEVQAELLGPIMQQHMSGCSTAAPTVSNPLHLATYFWSAEH